MCGKAVRKLNKAFDSSIFSYGSKYAGGDFVRKAVNEKLGFAQGGDGGLNALQQADAVDAAAQTEANIALAQQRKRRRLGSLTTGRRAIGAASGAPSGGTTSRPTVLSSFGAGVGGISY